jgi:hypothetical protein
MFLAFGCKKEFNNMSQFLQWVNDPDNELLIEKSINGFKLRMKYLPPEYLVIQEMSNETNYSQTELDSIYGYYSKSRTFILSISHPADKGADPDILFSSSRNYSEYAGKYMALSFGLQSYIKIVSQNKTYQPVLTAMEQTTSITGGRTFYLVFADVEQTDELLNEEILDIVFDDEIFNTGISHFRFTKEDMDNIPDFKFLNITKEL